MAKMLIWLLTIIGLAPAVGVAIAGIFVLRFVHRAGLPRRYGSSGSVFFHDSYFMLGGWRVDFNPQYWSVMVLLTGIIMVVVALVAILRS